MYKHYQRTASVQYKNYCNDELVHERFGMIPSIPDHTSLHRRSTMHALCVCVIMCVYVRAHACVFLCRIQTGVTFRVAYRRRLPHADCLATWTTRYDDYQDRELNMIIFKGNSN